MISASYKRKPEPITHVRVTAYKRSAGDECAE